MRLWILGARPRTLPAAVVPVVLGASAATGVTDDGVIWWRVAAALVVSLALQVGVNYANDYSDGVRGTDDFRVGPVRLVAGGLAEPADVKRAAVISFGVAAAAGLAIALATSPWLIVVGVASIAAGWGYTGGPKPYGYFGLGEIFVFVFFGLVATVGTTYAAIERVTALSFVVGSVAGAGSCALLVVNNLRDIPTDSEAGKRTLAVRLGDRATRRFYVVLLVLATFGIVAAGVDRPLALIGLFGAALSAVPARAVLSGATGAALAPILGATGRAQLVTGLTTAIGIAIGS